MLRYRRNSKRSLGRTAHHEAGHVVALIDLRIPFHWVAVRPLSDDYFTDLDRQDYIEDLPGGEHFDYSRYGTVALKESQSDFYSSHNRIHIIAIAGPMAEFRFAGSKGSPRISGTDKDISLQTAELGAVEFVLRGDTWPAAQRRCIKRAKEKALALVDRRWPQIQAVAAALMEERFLTRREVGKIVRGVKAS